MLGSKALPTITRADVVAVFDAIPVAQQAGRRNMFAILRRLFKWAIWRGDLMRSPMEGMETPPPVKARDRVLADDELRRVWLAASKSHRCFGPIVRLLIATGSAGRKSRAWRGRNWIGRQRSGACRASVQRMGSPRYSRFMPSQSPNGQAGKAHRTASSLRVKKGILAA